MRMISKLILNWAFKTFGETAHNAQERAKRLLEEACEVAQATDVSLAEAMAIADRTWRRPKGNPFQEVGGLFVTLLGYCAVMEIDPDQALENEVTRVLSRSDDYWRVKHDAKVKDGTASW